jgi:acetoin utilization protein AcuB
MHAPLTIQSIMSRPAVTIGLDQTIEDARVMLQVNHFHHLVVVEGEAVVGVVSDRDVLRNVSPFVGKLAERPADVASLHRRIHQVMTRHPMTVRPTTLAEDAARLMLDRGVSCLPVVDARGGCVGIVTIRDVARWAVRLLDGIERLRPAA